MSVTEPDVHQPGQREPPPSGIPGSSHRGPHRRRWWLAVASGLIAASVAVLGGLAARYQPLGFGGEWGGSFPGLPAGTLRAVNTFGNSAGQIYAPPQRGAFTLRESIRNSGPGAVTILAVTVVPPGYDGFPLPLAVAGRVLYLQRYPAQPSGGGPVDGLSLAPGQVIAVGIPLRMNAPCYVPNWWAGLGSFYVKERFLGFTHWVSLPLGTPLVYQMPGPLPGYSHGGLVCPRG
jgi:hypothetical protein